jgi:hypothetical protein
MRIVFLVGAYQRVLGTSMSFGNSRSPVEGTRKVQDSYVRDCTLAHPGWVNQGQSINSVFRHAGLDPASSSVFGGIERTGFRLSPE